MIARLTVSIPFAIVLPDGAAFKLYEYEEEGCRVISNPPVITDHKLKVDLPEEIVIDGARGFVANAIQIDFVKAEFDRRKDADAIDPSHEMLERALLGFLSRLRYATRAAHLRYFRLENTTWRLQYLHDDGSELTADPALIRAYGGRSRSVSLVSITPAVWDNLHQLDSDWKAPVWHDILLDAFGALPAIGTSVVLAATALEVFVADLLERLASDGDVPKDIWAWINDRDNWLKDPATDEQFDFLLKHFTGHSLKEDSTLWQAFKELRTARNKFVHEGAAAVGTSHVTATKAATLVVSASAVVNLIRGWIPGDKQWPQFDTPVQLSFVLPLT